MKKSDGSARRPTIWWAGYNSWSIFFMVG